MSVLARQNLTCDQFLAMDPGSAYFRTGASFYAVVQHCLQTVAPRNKFAAYVIESPNIAPDGFRYGRSGYDWLFAYIAFKLLTQMGCNSWNFLGNSAARTLAVRQYWEAFRVTKLSAADAAIVIGIANYVCGRLGPSVYHVAYPSVAVAPSGYATNGAINPAGQASDSSSNWYAYGFLAIVIGVMTLIALSPDKKPEPVYRER